MLEKLTIKNFQNIEHDVIEFDPLVTVFTGPSDSGKTARLRALRFACFNLPSGVEFIKHGEDTTTVILRADGRKIVRKRGKAINSYSLDGKEFKAFGQSVPDEISALLNMDSINWQRQLDAPYWFSDTAGQVSKNLNAIINLGLIDDALSYAAVTLRKARSEEDVSWQRLKAAEQRKQDLAWVPELDKRLKEIENKHTLLEEKREKRIRIADLLEKASELRDRRDKASSHAVALANVCRIAAKAVEVRQRRESIERLIQEYTQCETQLGEAKRNAMDSSTELHEKTGANCPLCGQTLLESSPATGICLINRQ